MQVLRLVGVGKATHTRHDTENVVVGGIDTDSGGGVGADSVGRDSEEEGGVIDTRQVASTGRLVLLRVQGERIDVDTSGRDVGVVLVRLDLVEVAALTLLETIVAVELDLGDDGRVLAGHTLNTGDGVTGLENRAIPPVGVVERLLTLPGVDDSIVAGHERVALHHPD